MSSGIDSVVSAYTQVDEQIRALTKQLATLKSQKLMYSEQLSEHIASTNKSTLEVGGRTIKLCQTKKKVFKRKNMEDSVSLHVLDESVKKMIFKDAIEETNSNYLKISKSK